MPRWTCIASVATLGLALAAAAPKTSSQHLPPYAQAYEPRSVDERGMWMEADEIERKLRDSPLRIRDEGLNAYVQGVLCRTVGEDRCKSVRIYIVEIPALGASMMPNGTMMVQSGLLLRTRNEAELGAVLGHEFAHFELRHTLQGFKKRRSSSDAAAWLAVLGGLSGVDSSVLLLSLAGSIFEFNREQEQAADLLGLKYLGSSPYPTSAAADLWRHVMAEADATAVGRKRKPRQRYSAGFFDTHPTDLKRATYLSEAAAKIGDGGNADAEGHRIAIASHRSAFLASQLKLNDFGGTEYLLAELAANGGWTGDLQFARGELYRQRGNPRDLVSAAQFYGEAIAAGYKAPEVQRNLGLALLRSGQKTEGRTALSEYLRLRPDASDAKAIAALLQD